MLDVQPDNVKGYIKFVHGLVDSEKKMRFGNYVQKFVNNNKGNIFKNDIFQQLSFALNCIG